MFSAKVGDDIKLGHYWQGVLKDEGKQPIVWSVLEIKYGKALLFSKYILDCKKNSILFGWLNKKFINEAFTCDEKKKIAFNKEKACYLTDKNGISIMIDGRVSCLNANEINDYFGDNSNYDNKIKSATKGTEFAKRVVNNQNANINELGGSLRINNCTGVPGTNGNSPYWIGSKEYEMAIVNEVGEIVDIESVDYDIGVRPAMWIHIDEKEYKKKIDKYNDEESLKFDWESFFE